MAGAGGDARDAPFDEAGSAPNWLWLAFNISSRLNSPTSLGSRTETKIENRNSVYLGMCRIEAGSRPAFRENCPAGSKEIGN